MLNFLWYIIVGFFAGWIARAVLPGADHMGFIATTVVGIVGGLIGGYLAAYSAKQTLMQSSRRRGLSGRSLALLCCSCCCDS